MAPAALTPILRRFRSGLKPVERPVEPHAQPYLTGLRGILVIESFLWLFMQTFVPTTVSAPNEESNLWQTILRDAFSVLFWNRSLIYSFFIILSARTVCVPFLKDATGGVFTKSLITRNLRMGLPLTVAGAIALLVFSNIDTLFLDEFSELVPGSADYLPEKPPTALAGFLSVYNIMWVNQEVSTQALNLYWPSRTLWAPALIYHQSYTVYVLMLILPYTRPAWHWQGLLVFMFGSFWMESWGWFSATGLLLADIAIEPELRIGIRSIFAKPNGYFVPTWVAAAGALAVGLIQKYMWAALAPQYLDKELVLHPTFETSGLDLAAFSGQPYPRLDDWFIVVGVFLMIELFQPFQDLLSTQPFTYFGNRSFSFFVAQCLLFYTVGIKVFVILFSQYEMSVETSAGVVFLIMLGLTPIAAEIFYRTVDLPSQWLGRGLFDWLRD